MDYDKTIASLYQHQSWEYNRKGLDRMRALLEKLGNPQNDFKSILVGGTNGKGSTSTMIAAILRENGFKTGLYTSPRLILDEERIRVGLNHIPREQFVEIINKLIPIADSMSEHPTFFEMLTATAFLYFKEQGVDYAVLEVGLGGLYDATNVVTPEVSVITNVSIDHTKWLGSTVEEIAENKVAIIKPGVPVVTAAEGSALKLISQTALNSKSPITIVKDPYEGVLGLLGEFQKMNAATAIAVIRALGGEISDEVIATALQNASMPGRFDRRGNVVLDVAHNAAGARALVDSIKALKYGRLIMVFGVYEDKEYEKISQTLSEVTDHVILTKPDHDRALDPNELKQYFKNSMVELNVLKAFELAKNEAKANDLILVTGSFSVVGPVLEKIQ